MKPRIGSANPNAIYRDRPQSAYQAARPRGGGEQMQHSRDKLTSAKNQKVKIPDQASEGRPGQKGFLIPKKDGPKQQPYWIQDAISMVKKGKSNRVKIG